MYELLVQQWGCCLACGEALRLINVPCPLESSGGKSDWNSPSELSPEAVNADLTIPTHFPETTIRYCRDLEGNEERSGESRSWIIQHKCEITRQAVFRSVPQALREKVKVMFSHRQAKCNFINEQEFEHAYEARNRERVTASLIHDHNESKARVLPRHIDEAIRTLGIRSA